MPLIHEALRKFDIMLKIEKEKLKLSYLELLIPKHILEKIKEKKPELENDPNASETRLKPVLSFTPE